MNSEIEDAASCHYGGLVEVWSPVLAVHTLRIMLFLFPCDDETCRVQNSK